MMNIGRITDMMAAIDAATFGNAVDPIISNIVSPVIMLMFAVGLVVFTFGVLQYVWGSADGDARKLAKNSMLGGIIGMFVMLSAWGIVHLIANTIRTI